LKLAALRLPEGSRVPELAEAVASRDGRLLVVGGWVRDRLKGWPSKDLDLEIFGLSEDAVSDLMTRAGFSPPVGRQFPVWRRSRDHLDVGFPRAGADVYQASIPDSLECAFREACRHRDLTINAIGWDPIDEALIDPWNGRADLDRGCLAAVDLELFGADPLRVLRVARLSAQLEARVDPDLLALCRRLSLDDLPVERIAGELRRILCESKRPSRAFEWLASAEQLEVFAPIAALRGVPQDARWHPEGDVYVHTLMVIDRAAEIAASLDPDTGETLLFAALCHDLGKPETTSVEADRIRSLGHEAASAQRTRDWLEALRLPQARVRAVETLVGHHLAPGQFVAQGAGPAAYRRLARRLAAGGVGLEDLERLARADHLGRTTEEARSGRFDAGRAFLEAAEAAQVRAGTRPDVVSAADLIEHGVAPGPELGRLLARCREVQDETGWCEPERVLERVLRES
jgi:tRNA nucleotidyltransferase (CCA-adding enzyme)